MYTENIPKYSYFSTGLPSSSQSKSPPSRTWDNINAFWLLSLSPLAPSQPVVQAGATGEFLSMDQILGLLARASWDVGLPTLPLPYLTWLLPTFLLPPVPLSLLHLSPAVSHLVLHKVQLTPQTLPFMLFPGLSRACSSSSLTRLFQSLLLRAARSEHLDWDSVLSAPVTSYLFYFSL